MTDSGRYQLMWKSVGKAPKHVTSFSTMKQVLSWLRGFHKNYKDNSVFTSGQSKYYFIDKLTGHEVGSTLDLIDREN